MNIRRLSSLLFVSFIALPIPVGFLMCWLYDTVNDENIYWSLRWILVPAIVVTAAIQLRNAEGERLRWRIPGILLSACLVGVFVTFLMSASFVLLLNGLATLGEPVRLEGTVAEKLRAGFRGRGPSVVITDRVTGEQVKIYVPQRRWNALAVGQTFGRDVRKGLLGIRFHPSAYREG